MPPRRQKADIFRRALMPADAARCVAELSSAFCSMIFQAPPRPHAPTYFLARFDADAAYACLGARVHAPVDSASAPEPRTGAAHFAGARTKCAALAFGDAGETRDVRTAIGGMAKLGHAASRIPRRYFSFNIVIRRLPISFYDAMLSGAPISQQSRLWPAAAIDLLSSRALTFVDDDAALRRLPDFSLQLAAIATTISTRHASRINEMTTALIRYR